MMTVLNQVPVVKVGMLIRKPVEVVFEAFIDPAITSRFWFTKGSGRLETGRRVQWEWEMYGASADVDVKEIEENKRILIEFGSTVEWVFTPRAENETFVTITNTGFKGDGDDIVKQAIDSTEGFTIVLCGLKAFLEHGIALNLVSDKDPDAHV
jgi:uncharacterized protein YndB with AHSA1/START domain